jgi:integrase
LSALSSANVALRDEKSGASLVGMHAFRHTLSNAALNADVDESHIVGRAGGESDIARDYRGELSLTKKRDIIEQIAFDIDFFIPAI